MDKGKFEKYIYQVMREKIRVKPAGPADHVILGTMHMVRSRMESGTL